MSTCGLDITSVSTPLRAFQKHLYKTGFCDKPLFSSTIDGPSLDNYFNLNFYGIESSIDPDIFLGFKMTSKIREDISTGISTSTSLSDNFGSVLEAQCKSLAALKPGQNEPTFFASLDSHKPFIGNALLKGLDSIGSTYTHLAKSLQDAYTYPEYILVWFAWIHSDSMFANSTYALVEKLSFITRCMFMMGLLYSEPAFLENIILVILKTYLVHTEAGNTNTNNALDDVTKTNTYLSNDIHDVSRELLLKRDQVEKTQDNIRSLVVADKSVQQIRNRAWWVMIALVVLLVLSVIGLAAAYLMDKTSEIYLVSGLLVLGVLGFEAFKGAELLFSIDSNI